jgi:hypothetical protein
MREGEPVVSADLDAVLVLEPDLALALSLVECGITRTLVS